jgi:hypothetical protein
MPKPKNPEALEWYVYQFEVNNVPFYVGIGHKERASDRLRWVCSQIKRQLAGKRPNWVTHTEVIREFLLTPVPVKTHYIRKRICRAEALRVEKGRIRRLLKGHYILANKQYNPSHPTWQEVVKFVRKKSKASRSRST